MSSARIVEKVKRGLADVRLWRTLWWKRREITAFIVGLRVVALFETEGRSFKLN